MGDSKVRTGASLLTDSGRENLPLQGTEREDDSNASRRTSQALARVICQPCVLIEAGQTGCPQDKAASTVRCGEHQSLAR